MKKKAKVITIIILIYSFGFLLSFNSLQAANDKNLEQKVEKYILAGDYEGAINMLKDYIRQIKDLKEKKKNLAAAYYHLGRTYFQTGFDNEANENLRSAYISYPNLNLEEQENDLYFKEKARDVKNKVSLQIKSQIKEKPVEKETQLKPKETSAGPYLTPRGSYLVNFSKKSAKALFKEKGFYDRYMNNKGNFANIFIMVNNTVIHDQATGLMWMLYGSPKKYNITQTKQWIRIQNQKNYLGFNNWRLPTLEEAMSLVERKRVLNQKGKQWKKLNIDKRFGLQSEIWTGDKVEDDIYWIVSFDGGFAQKHNYLKSFEYKYYVRAVRR